jgi:hypothetical protein
MRAPRYRFPDEVRSTTRSMASRMVHDGTVAGTPEDLEAWIAGAPDARESLERGGYGTRFTAADLFPLYEAAVVRSGGSVPRPVEEAPPAPRRGWMKGLAVVLVVLAAAAVVAVML